MSNLETELLFKNNRLLTALIELRDRLKDRPDYAKLTEDEELEIGGDTAEFSYLVRVANEALDYSGAT